MFDKINNRLIATTEDSYIRLDLPLKCNLTTVKKEIMSHLQCEKA